MHARPKARLTSGRLLLLESGVLLTPPNDWRKTESLEAVAVRQLPLVCSPYVSAPHGPDAGKNGAAEKQYFRELAERSLQMPVTCLAGTTDRLSRFLEEVRRMSGRERVADIWPQLAAVLYTRSAAANVSRLDEQFGRGDVLCMEMYVRPEGAIALEDPRHRSLRLLPDHGIYFEFVPVDEIGKPRPPRFSAADVRVGVPYALALSSPAGIWACLVGGIVQFERRDPPLLRLVETRTLWEPPAVEPPAVPPARLRSAHPFPVQPPHPRSGGIPATLPGRSFRTALSGRADRV
jgi:hypothetical protein